MSRGSGPVTDLAAQQGLAGQLRDLWCYPVKSALGVRIPRVELCSDRAMPGDREWAVLDVHTGRILTAKNEPRLLHLWTEVGPAESCHQILVGVAELDEPVPIQAAGPTLSAWLGRAVEVVSWRPGEHHAFDFGWEVSTSAHCFGDTGDVLHLVTEQTLDAVGEQFGYAGGSEARARLRPNLVLATDSPPFAEAGWVGRELRFDQVQLTVVAETKRCVLIQQPQTGLPARAGLLGWAQESVGAWVGCYVAVKRGGALASGEAWRRG